MCFWGVVVLDGCKVCHLSIVAFWILQLRESWGQQSNLHYWTLESGSPFSRLVTKYKINISLIPEVQRELWFVDLHETNAISGRLWPLHWILQITLNHAVVCTTAEGRRKCQHSSLAAAILPSPLPIKWEAVVVQPRPNLGLSLWQNIRKRANKTAIKTNQPKSSQKNPWPTKTPICRIYVA